MVSVTLIGNIVKFLFLDFRFRCKLTYVPYLHVSVAKAIFPKVYSKIIKVYIFLNIFHRNMTRVKKAQMGTLFHTGRKNQELVQVCTNFGAQMSSCNSGKKAQMSSAHSEPRT